MRTHIRGADMCQRIFLHVGACTLHRQGTHTHFDNQGYNMGESSTATDYHACVCDSFFFFRVPTLDSWLMALFSMCFAAICVLVVLHCVQPFI